jgi:cytochrome c553
LHQHLFFDRVVIKTSRRKEVREMRILKIAILSMAALGLIFSAAFAGKHLPEERGKALFNDVKFAGGTAGKSCNSCHPGGRGLEKSADKKEFRIMGRTLKSLEDAVNFCIVQANKGKAIAADSPEMKDMVAYIKSLKRKAPAPRKPGY